jgi:hypothetical protein
MISKIAVTLTGNTPLLMHNAALSDDFNPTVREMKRINAKRTKKTDEDKIEVARLEFIGGMYYDNELGPVIPSKMLNATILNSAKITRERPTVVRAGLVFDGLQYKLEYDGPRDLDSLWGDGTSKFVSRESIAVQASRVMRTRPIFCDWGVSFNVEFDTAELDPDRFAEFVIKAGKMVGVGDWRPQKNGPYGKFSAEITEL